MQENTRVLLEQLLTNMIGFQFLQQWRLWCTHGNSAIDFCLLTHYGRISHWQGKCFPFPPLWFYDTWKHISFSVLQGLDQSIPRLLCLQWSSTHSLRILMQERIYCHRRWSTRRWSTRRWSTRRWSTRRWSTRRWSTRRGSTRRGSTRRATKMLTKSYRPLFVMKLKFHI